MAFNLQQFKAKYNMYKLVGICTFVVGLILPILDKVTNSPLPREKGYILYWLSVVGLVLVGVAVWAYSKRLLLEETIGLADNHQRRGKLTLTEIINEMQVSIATAEKIISKLEKKGYAVCEYRENVTVWVFPDVKAKYDSQQDFQQQF